MTASYRLDPNLSRLTVQAFASGMLSFLGHSPTFAAREFTGEIDIDRDAARVVRLAVTVSADTLWVADGVSAGDRKEIEGAMRTTVLETATYPTVRYESDDVTANEMAPGRYHLRINGRMSLHGVSRPLPLEAELLIFGDGVRLRGASALNLSDYRIKPVIALGGTIKLRDELKVSFDVAAVPEAP
jgi:polyisoprenoid-binding protein YceI